LRGKTAILVDDGIATGSTMEAAVLAARAGGAAKVVAAAPTASRDACVMLRRSADAVEVLAMPAPYIAVGAWHAALPQLADEGAGRRRGAADARGLHRRRRVVRRVPAARGRGGDRAARPLRREPAAGGRVGRRAQPVARYGTPQPPSPQ